MESTVDSYLHKKFKKQLSYEPRNKNENKSGPKPTDQNQEKKTLSLENSHQVKETFCRTDNTHTVPNTSTNKANDSLNVRNDISNVNVHESTSKYDCLNLANDSIAYNTDGLNVNKSSISLENPIVTLQSHNISYVSNIHRYEVNFDKKFSCSDVVSNSHGQKSSILDTNLYKYNYVKSDDNVSPERDQNNHESEKRSEEVPPQPDKSSGGKYVCNYCNLACSKPSVLQKHIRAHTNERPYPCVSCGFSFKTRSNLYKHRRSRTHANRVLGSKARGEVIIEEQQSSAFETIPSNEQSQNNETERPIDYKTKLYKPRFHTASKFYQQVSKENIEDDNKQADHGESDILSHHISELITKNNSKVNSNDAYLLKRKQDEYNSEFAQVPKRVLPRDNEGLKVADEPLNLTNKVRKRCMSEAVESKSLIKEILLKNLASDMQCPHCKMIFQTVTELELHKLRNCKGFVAPGAKYARSSSVNVASILTQNKNAFDSMPQMQAVFPLKSPGPFLGKTRLVESDKTKSFSFDDGLPNISMYPKAKEMITSKYLLAPSSLQNDVEKKAPVKLFGGEVKISENIGDNKRFHIENNNDGFEPSNSFMSYGGKMSENRVIRSGLHSGGTVLTNKGNFDGDSLNKVQNVIRMYDGSPDSPGMDVGKRRIGFSTNLSERKKPPDLVISFSSEDITTPSPSYMKYTNILDFSQNAVKLLTPNLKQPNLMVPGLPVPNKFTYPTPENPHPLKIEVDMDNNNPHNLTRSSFSDKTTTPENSKLIHKKFQVPAQEIESQPLNMFNPMNIVVNGKVVRYVPGMPGPIIAESPVDSLYTRSNLPSTPSKVSSNLIKIADVEKPKERDNSEETKRISLPYAPKLVKPAMMEKLEIKTDFPTKSFESTEMRSPVIKLSEMKSPAKVTSAESKKFARPNSLALKPTSASMKQHHGLTPTLLNQILISPDTPRVAKKYVQQYLNGNYFSYLGLKSTTRQVYCTLNKTQPSYVPHFKTLSMYSEWRQQDTKTEKYYAAGYDSRQISSKYTVAHHKNIDLMVHSSYKSISPESTRDKDETQKPNSITGGYECNDNYTYIRGRGRGRYVCEQCGIRCKKPSMLKKHIRTHSNDRPYTCSHCNFSFKTKGNLTKHMKSKAHTKNSTTSIGSNSSTQQSGTPSSESETEDSGMDSSDESTRHQEHEAAYGLLSLSQKSTHNITTNSFSPTTSALADQSPHQITIDAANRIMNTEEIAFVSKTNYAKNKCLEQPTALKLNIMDIGIPLPEEKKTTDVNSVTLVLGKSSQNRPLTYPYIMSDVILDEPMSVSSENTDNSSRYELKSPDTSEPKCITQFHVIQRYASSEKESTSKEVSRETIETFKNVPEPSFPKERLTAAHYPLERNERSVIVTQNLRTPNIPHNPEIPSPSIKINDNIVFNGTFKEKRKRKLMDDTEFCPKNSKMDEVIDLSLSTVQKNDSSVNSKLNSKSGDMYPKYELDHHKNNENSLPKENSKLSESEYKNVEYSMQYPKINGNVLILKNVGVPNEDSNEIANINSNYLVEPQAIAVSKSDSPKLFGEFDNSAMETLADIATKQVKLEKNAMAKSVASEYLKLATKNEIPTGENEMFQPISKEVNDLIVKPEGNKSCTICSKSFSKPSQLRLHMNVHYLERPFRCEPCSVSFRTKGHLQKHERSASHHNKLSSSPAQSSSEPRPFKCTDCNIAFRIHGHLAKHLRSKMHIMKLECLAKIPFGLYAELERSNSLLTEINTADGDQCLDSLKALAKKVFMNDPAKLKNLVKSSVVVETE